MLIVEDPISSKNGSHSGHKNLHKQNIENLDTSRVHDFAGLVFGICSIHLDLCFVARVQDDAINIGSVAEGHTSQHHVVICERGQPAF
jgi:hypothetical protein